jgi:dTDP-glucose pyrophosphorylase
MTFMALDAALLVSPAASIREALEAITKNARQVVMVADDEGCLLGLVTDGDIRKAMLRGLSLEGRITDVMNRTPVVVAPGVARTEALALMQRRGMRHLPVVDGDRRIVDLLLLDELLKPAVLPNSAVLMAGGSGSRLRPLTDDVPKPLLRVGGKPLLEILLERLQQAGVREFRITVNYKSQMIEDYFGDGSRWDVRVSYVREREPRGTAGSLRMSDDRSGLPFFLVNGDILTKCDFRAMLSFHEGSGAEMTVGAVTYGVELPFGVLEVDGQRLRGLSEKPRFDFLINSGIYVLAPSVLELIPPDRAFDIPDLIRTLLAGGRPVAAFPVRDYWLDVGRHDDFWKADRDVAEGLLE